MWTWACLSLSLRWSQECHRIGITGPVQLSSQQAAQNKPSTTQLQDLLPRKGLGHVTHGEPITYLLFRLGLLHIVSPHLDARGEDASGEIGHVDPQEVRHLLSS